MNYSKLNIILIFLILVSQGCQEKYKVDYSFMGVEDEINLSYADKKLKRVKGADVKMYSIELESNLILTYTFFSEKPYSKKWVYFIENVDSITSHFPKGVICETANCQQRLLSGERVILRNDNNNQYYTCALDYEEGQPNLRILYLFKQKKNSSPDVAIVK